MLVVVLRRQRRDDELVRVLVEREFEAADVAAIQLIRPRTPPPKPNVVTPLWTQTKHRHWVDARLVDQARRVVNCGCCKTANGRPLQRPRTRVSARRGCAAVTGIERLGSGVSSTEPVSARWTRWVGCSTSVDSAANILCAKPCQRAAIGVTSDRAVWCADMPCVRRETESCADCRICQTQRLRRVLRLRVLSRRAGLSHSAWIVVSALAPQRPRRLFGSCCPTEASSRAQHRRNRVTRTRPLPIEPVSGQFIGSPSKSVSVSVGLRHRCRRCWCRQAG